MLQVLAVIANPANLPRLNADTLWTEMQAATKVLPGAVIETLPNGSEAALRKALTSRHWDVIHLVAHTQARSAAHYATLALEGSDGQARNVTADYLSSLFAAGPPGAVLLETHGPFEPLRDAISARGIVTIGVESAAPGARIPLLAKLYAEAARALSGPHYVAPERAAAAAVGALHEVPETIVVPTWHEALRAKRAANQFDVFLCHNTLDKPAVKRIGQALKEKSLLPWLDAWELQPGQPWQQLLERQIGTIRSAAVFVGTAGMGPWQEQELYGFLRAFVERKVPVIPVILPDAPAVPELPIFLQAMMWVDFRNLDPDPLTQLIWGITGERPDDLS